MLTSLKANLERAINPPLLEKPEEGEEPSPASLAPSTTSSSSSSLTLDSDEAEEDRGSETPDDLDLSDPVWRANDVIDRIYRLASIIKKPVSSTENSRVRDFIAKQIARGEIQDLEDAKDYAQRHMEARFATDASDANRHATKDQPITIGFPAVPMTQSDYSSPIKESPSPKPGGGVAWSATSASSVNKARFANYAKSTALSGITRSAVARQQQLDVPLPPKNADERLHKVTCPYCRKIISKEETQEPRWTRHILKDINPYVCLFEDCNRGDILASIEEWLGHMQ
ncbi:hypothetical protein QQZ08_012457 [Neonectria magnoliae]|uniref:Uncharacterized protein n=1 Tax=Neonectria magnoliae TaxID=2732573 RepID=A0ABR1H1S5_9HYPO